MLYRLSYTRKCRSEIPIDAYLFVKKFNYIHTLVTSQGLEPWTH